MLFGAGGAERGPIAVLARNQFSRAENREGAGLCEKIELSFSSHFHRIFPFYVSGSFRSIALLLKDVP